MSGSRIQYIGPTNDKFYIHSKNPGASLTFIKVASSVNDGVKVKEGDPSSVLFIKSGIVSLSITYSKSSPFHQFEAIILPTQHNLLSEILPGDYCLIHIVNDQAILDEIERDVINLKPVNYEKYGFKGVFKVESIRQNYQIIHETGAKIVTYQITGHAFKELNSVIYYNPFLIFSAEQNDSIVFLSRLAEEFSNFLAQKKLDDHKNDYVIQFLWSAFLGKGGAFKSDKKVKDTPNTMFMIPSVLLMLMGMKPKAKAQLKDLYQLLTGIQGYKTYEPFIKAPNISVTVFLPQFWNQVPIWNILKSFENAPVEEMYATFRKDNNGRILPWVFYRQIPYLSKKIKVNVPVTYFHELPVWTAHDSLILSYNIGRDDSHRINYVSVFAIAPAASPEMQGSYMNWQVANNNYQKDVFDIQRHGLRSAIITTRHDNLMAEKKDVHAVTFTKILADVMLNGHLKLNGIVQMAGIQEAITIGDNFLLNDILFHIEGLKHEFHIDMMSGKPHFTTIAMLAYGVKADANSPVKFVGLRNTTLDQEKQNVPSLPLIEFNPIDINKLDIDRNKQSDVNSKKGSNK